MRLFQCLMTSLLMMVVEINAMEDSNLSWNMDALSVPPEFSWSGHTNNGARGLYFEGEPYQGKSTRVFAYYAVPEETNGQVPAVVLAHGGGGTAFPHWSAQWAKRGYAAIALDFTGVGPERVPLPDGAPSEKDDVKFFGHGENLKDAWTYHGVANIIKAHSLLRSFPEVDPDRIGITGISWGGYLTCLVAGIDHRFKAAAPVYGCGFLHENSVWLPYFEKLGDEGTSDWVRHFDPSSLIGNSRMPMLFVTSPRDFAYPFDSFKKTYALVADRTLCVRPTMGHSHQHGWRPKEIGLFFDHHFSGKPTKSFPKVSRIKREGNSLSATYQAEVPVKSAVLCYTTDSGEWKKRKWQTTPAAIRGTNVCAELPVDKGICFFFNVEDIRGVTVSSEHEEL